jgi:hypothetical protein
MSEVYQYYFYPSIHPWSYDPCRLGQFFQFLNLYTVSRTPWVGDQPNARPLLTHRRTQTQNKRTQTSMQVGFEPTIPVFDRAKRIDALDRAANVIGQMVQQSMLLRFVVLNKNFYNVRHARIPTDFWALQLCSYSKSYPCA